MKKEDIKTLTIIGGEVIINGISNTINLSLEDGIEAVQYHRGHRMLEEPLMKEVKFEKYQEFIDEWQIAEDIKNSIPTIVDDTQIPTSLTPRQTRLILLKNNLLDKVEEAVSTSREYSIYWEYALEIDRNDSVLQEMTTSLGITKEMLDDMFIEGSKL